MTIKYTWQIGPLNVKLSENGLTNIVYNINWNLIGQEDTYTASVYGSTGVLQPDVNSFTPYEDLTEEQVKQWVFNSMGFDTVKAYEENIANNIELQKNPVDASLQPPWLNKDNA